MRCGWMLKPKSEVAGLASGGGSGTRFLVVVVVAVVVFVLKLPCHSAFAVSASGPA